MGVPMPPVPKNATVPKFAGELRTGGGASDAPDPGLGLGDRGGGTDAPLPNERVLLLLLEGGGGLPSLGRGSG